MMIGPLLLVMIAVAALVFRLATLAAALMVGVALGLLAYRTGAGALGGLVVGVICAGGAFGLARWLAAPGRATWQRLTVAAAFAAPAAACGYALAHGLVAASTPSPAWRVAVAIFGALVVGACAFAKIYDRTSAPSNEGGRLAA